MKKNKNTSIDLIHWYQKYKRDLPWRHTNDPYKIWVSEIMLQQTQVIQGMPYYIKFLNTYPDIFQFAKAEIDDFLKLWQGLGYYSRARNMHKTAQIIVNQYKGIFPKTYQDILKLPGVGKYTAAAICSFAYQMPYYVIDGNVNRVISRLFSIDESIDSNNGKLKIEHALQSIFDSNAASLFNQAIMELGAIVCKPKMPKCEICPLQNTCEAFNKELISKLPIRTKKTKVIHRYFNFYFFQYNQSTFIQKRLDSDIWQGLYQWPLIESEQNSVENTSFFDLLNEIPNANEFEISEVYQVKHKLTHQILNANIFRIKLKKMVYFKKNDIFEIKLTEIKQKYPVPILIDRYIKEKLNQI